MRSALTVAGYAMREAVRRRVFLVVLVLTVGFLALYGFGAGEAFKDSRGFAGSGSKIIDAKAFTGATVFGLAMFATLFLGVILAIFLTLGVVRGDAERGLLQPMVVRPLGRAALLGARLAAAAGVAGGYTLAVYLGAMVITGAVGDWWPDRVLEPGLALAAGVAVVAALSLLGSVFLSTTANGIAVFMVFGAGLVAGLLGQIGHALGSGTLQDIASAASWALPFEALYEDGLHGLIADTGGLTGVVLQLGPFGGSMGAGPLLWPWALAYLGLVLAAAIAAFARRDL